MKATRYYFKLHVEGQKIWIFFSNFCGPLGIYELYQHYADEIYFWFFGAIDADHG